MQAADITESNGMDKNPISETSRDVGKIAVSAWAKSIAEINSSISKQVAAMLPKLDASAILPNYSGIMSDFHEQVQRTLQGLTAQWAKPFIDIRRRIKGIFPENWKEVKNLSFSKIKIILLEEGIPLAWVPRGSIVQSLLNAENAAARRKIVGRNWQIIAVDCDALLEKVQHSQLKPDVNLTKQSISALREGHAAASQALSANLLDSVMRRHIDESLRKKITNSNNKLDMDDFILRESVVLAPIWQGFASYWPNKGDPIPYRFTRHASAHGVSRRQYSKINAVVALMLVSSLLKLLDDEFSR
jgi:hypothetical protein